MIGMKIQKVWFRNSKGQRLAGIMHLPAKPTHKAIIICHGLTGDKSDNGRIWPRAIANALQNAGFAVLRFDFTGNGDSEGEFYEGTLSQEVSDVRFAVNYLKINNYEKFGLIGHSLGGAVVLLSAKNVKPKAIALLNSSFDVFNLKKYFSKEKFNIHGLAEAKIFGFKKVITKNYLDNFEQDIAKPISKLKIPKLFIVGLADTWVKQRLNMYELAIKPKKQILMKNSDHWFSGEEHKLAGNIAKFFARYMK